MSFAAFALPPVQAVIGELPVIACMPDITTHLDLNNQHFRVCAASLVSRRLEVVPLLQAPAAVGARLLHAVAGLLLLLHHLLPGEAAPRSTSVTASPHPPPFCSPLGSTLHLDGACGLHSAATACACCCGGSAHWLAACAAHSCAAACLVQDEDTHLSLRELLATSRGRITVACDAVALLAMTPFVIIEVRAVLGSRAVAKEPSA